MIFRAELRMDTEHPCFLALLECLVSRPCETVIHVPQINSQRFRRDMEVELLSSLSGVEREELRAGALTVEQQLRLDDAKRALEESGVRFQAPCPAPGSV
jgi:hypothetical protein